MKKIFLFATIMALGLSSTFAQGKGDVEFGLNIGYNISNLWSSYSSDTGDGLNVGGSADFYCSHRLSIKTKVIYDQKGWNNGLITDLDTGISYRTNFNMNYLTIPVMANWHFGPGGNCYMSLGPYVGIMLNAKETRFDTDVKDAFTAADFGVAFGIGVKIPVSHKMKIFLEYDGQSGFTDVFQDNSNYGSNGRSSFNAGVNFIMK